MRTATVRWAVLAACGALVLAGCDGGGAGRGDASLTTGAGRDPSGVATAPPSDVYADDAVAGAGAGERAGDGAAAATAATRAYGAAEGDGAAPRGAGGEAAQSGGVGLRAGSVDDNERFDDYLRYRREFLALGLRVHDLDVGERHVVTVVGADGRPVGGATVDVFAAGDDRRVARLRTANDGRALFHPRAVGVADAVDRFTAKVTKGNAEAQVEFGRGSGTRTVRLGSSFAARNAIDILFLLDATGSMSDEIDRLKKSVESVASRIASLDARPAVRFGMTVYRDRGDEFVTRTTDFTADVDAFAAELRRVTAAGGGDTPESLDAGLHEALRKPSWRGDDTAKLVFLVGDAPPHLDDDDEPSYALDAIEAVERGIKVHPIASSGLDDAGEYVFRQLGQLTLGRFVFLTYGADGEPGDSTPHHVDKYAVLSLDSLVVQLVADELGDRGASGQ